MSERKITTKESDYQINSGTAYTSAAFGHDCQILSGGDDQNRIYVWKVTNTKPKLELTGQKTCSTILRFSNNQTNSQLFSGTFGGTLHVWELQGQREIVKFLGHKAGVSAVCSSDNDDIVATGSHDTRIKLWDLRQKQNTLSFKKHTQKIETLEMSPDNLFVASGAADGSLRIWDLRANKEFSCYMTPGQHSVTCCQFNPQYQTIANGSTDKTIKLWDLVTNQYVTMTSPDVAPIQHI